MKLSFIGTGYVGLVTAAVMADLGHEIICADISRAKINQLRKNIMPIYEEGLAELVEKSVKAGRLSFTNSVPKAIRETQVVFSSVGTPEDKRTGQADLRYVREVAKSFAQNLNKYKILVNKSTVPVGTAEKVRRIIMRYNKKKIDFDVVSNPEFLREGSAISDFVKPDRIVVGIDSARAKEIMQEVYAPLIKKTGAPLVFISPKSSEISKYAANSFLATKISFINEMANFCDKVGGNISEVSEVIGLDKRIGERFLQAGIGYGGSCFPKDVKALIYTGKANKHDFKIIKAVDWVNNKQKKRPIDILKKKIKPLKGKKVALWGLAFKPKTDDVREAPALVIAQNLLQSGVEVNSFDPVALKNAKEIIKNERMRYFDNPYAALEGAVALVIATDWDDFLNPDYKTMKEKMDRPLIIDGRNILDSEEAVKNGFEYCGVGLG